MIRIYFEMFIKNANTLRGKTESFLILQ